MRLIRYVAPVFAIAAAMLATPAASFAQISVNITIAPPPIPVYEQPVIPAEGYLWTPGYWSYGPEGYFWVPGTWVEPPTVGLLWTPGYWGFVGGVYAFNVGYWGPQVGFYGGINYGFGYGGDGYGGGRWEGGHFAYNTTVNNVNVTIIHNTYNERIVEPSGPRTSFNGPGGVAVRPNAQQEAAMHEKHVPPSSVQTEHEHAAAGNHALLASENHGKPAIAATSKPGDFTHGAVPAKAAGGPVRNETNRPGEASRPGENNRPGNTHPDAHPGETHTGNAPGNNAGHPNDAGHPGTAPHAIEPNNRPEGGAHPNDMHRDDTHTSNGHPAEPHTATTPHSMNDAHPRNEARPDNHPAAPSHPMNEGRPGNEARPGNNAHPMDTHPAGAPHPAEPKPAAHPENAHPAPGGGHPEGDKKKPE